MGTLAIWRDSNDNANQITPFMIKYSITQWDNGTTIGDGNTVLL